MTKDSSEDMPGERQRQYLHAMGIETWIPRHGQLAATPNAPETFAEAPAPALGPVDGAATSLKLGPGRDGILLVCSSADEPASRLAEDIARALGSVPVWAWPSAGADATPLGDAVAENLFTTVAVFGEELATKLFDEVPASVGSASLLVLPSMRKLRESAAARRALWDVVCRAGMVSITRR